MLWRYSYGVARREARTVLTERQGGRCAGCLLPRTPLLVDHDHDTDLVRGLLCHTCNTREGKHPATVAWSLYLEEPPAMLDTTLAVLDSFVERCSVELGTAAAVVAEHWRGAFEGRAREVVGRRQAAFEAWRNVDPRPDNPEFEEWLAQHEEAQAIGEESINVDVDALHAAGLDDMDISSAKWAVAMNLMYAIRRAYVERQIEQVTAELAAAVEEHTFTGVGRCEHRGCDFTPERHPLGSKGARLALARFDSLTALQADLTGALSAAA